VAEVSRQEAARELLFRRCSEQTADGFLYFFENLWVVQIPRKGPQHPQARRFQRQVAELLMGERAHPLMLIVLKARQIGFTTIAMAFAVWWCLFHHDSPWLVASRGEDAAKKNLARAQYGWRRLPEWFKARVPACITDSAERLAWNNESRIDSIPASASSGRSDSVYGVLFDEAAHMDNPADLYASLEPLCYGPFVVFSSANGMGGFFHDHWLDAHTPDSAWESLFCPWSEVEGRDQDWYDRTKRKYRGQLWLFYQEYPSDPAEAFARSGRVAYGPDLLAEQEFTMPDWRLRWTGAGFDVDQPLLPRQEDDLELWVWEKPTVLRDERGKTLQRPNYVLFCDTAEGLEKGDWTAISVWDANEKQVVATCRTHWPIEDLDEVLAWLGHWYHEALIMVERNNHGIVPIVGLQKRFRYTRLYRMANLGERTMGDRTPRYGWVTSKSSKPKMVHDFLRALRDGEVQVHDPRWQTEAATFVADGRGGYAASEQNHDDMMLAVLGGWQGVQEIGAYPIVWSDDLPQPPTWADVLGLEPDETQARGSSAIRIGRRGRQEPSIRRTITLWS
jgi:hypothetical protein